jgi:hypothetical protein
MCTYTYMKYECKFCIRGYIAQVYDRTACLRMAIDGDCDKEFATNSIDDELEVVLYHCDACPKHWAR